ncbi:MAG: ribosome silencing factor [Anaerolineae bacterium]|nr:ribosome silencing factor [Anaerolineae bacterium]
MRPCGLEAPLDSLEFAQHIVNVLNDKKATDILLLDLRPDAILADFFVIATGTSDRQLRALADYVREGTKEHYNKLPLSVEGTSDSGWVLMDYGDVIVHLFIEAKREYYDLEGLWREANILLNIE